MLMIKIYCIEDINDNKYIGSTKIKYLCDRLSNHRIDKRDRYGECSSCELNLDYCIIYTLEECDEKDRMKRESYWISKIECVNHYKLNFDRKEYRHRERTRNRENECQRIRRAFKRSFGGDPRYFNNLLNISLDLFQ